MSDDKKHKYRDNLSKTLQKVKELLGRTGFTLDSASRKLHISKKNLRKKMRKIKHMEQEAILNLSAVEIFADYKLQQDTNIIRLQRLYKKNAKTKPMMAVKIVDKITAIQTRIIEKGQELGLIVKAAARLSLVGDETEDALKERKKKLLSKLYRDNFDDTISRRSKPSMN